MTARQLGKRCRVHSCGEKHTPGSPYCRRHMHANPRERGEHQAVSRDWAAR